MAVLTNMAPGARGLGLRNGAVVLAGPGETVTVDLTAAELAEVAAAGCWQVADDDAPKRGRPVKVALEG